MNDTLDLIKHFNWHQPSWDLFILGFWLVASIIYAFSSGRGRILTILVSTYIARLFVEQMPGVVEKVNEKVVFLQGGYAELALFVVLFLVLFLFLSKYGFRTSLEGRHLTAIVFGIGFAVLQVGLFVSIVLTMLPESLTSQFAEFTHILFIIQPAPLIWMVLPLVYLVVLGKFFSDRAEL